MEERSSPENPAAQALAARHAREQTYYDCVGAELAQPRARYYAWGIEEEAERFALDQLGPLANRTVADFGCGAGRLTLQLAQRGARVLAFDLSSQVLFAARDAASEQGFHDRVACQQMSGEKLAFLDGSLKLIYGQSVLHHLDLEAAHGEVLRVLAPGGVAVFLEPLAHNPLVKLYRWLTPRRRTPDERPLSWAQVSGFARGFQESEHWEFCLLALLAVPLAVFPSRGLFRAVLKILQRADRLLLSKFSFLRRYCWITVIRVVR